MSKCNKATANSIFETENPRLKIFLIHDTLFCKLSNWHYGRSHKIDNYIFIANRNKMKKKTKKKYRKTSCLGKMYNYMVCTMY